MALRALTMLIMASHAAFLPAGLPATPAKELSPQETALDAYIDRHFEDQVGFLERVVNINSETMNHEGVRRVARIFEEELESRGFATRQNRLVLALTFVPVLSPGTCDVHTVERPLPVGDNS